MIQFPPSTSTAGGIESADSADSIDTTDPSSDIAQGDSGQPGQPIASDSLARFGGLYDLHPAVQAFAYFGSDDGGGGSSGGGGAPLPSTVTQADLLKEMKGGFVDANNLSDPLKKALADANIDPSELSKIADKQGRVSPEKLFKFIDKFDSNGKPGSFSAYTTDFSGAQVPTKAGALYQALKAEVGANREVANGGLNAKAFDKLAEGHGVLDLNFLSGEVKKALGGAVSESDLAAIAGADGQIKGKKEFAALHALLDKSDGRADGIASGKVKNADGTIGDSKVATLLGALQDDVALNRTLPQYAQPGTKAASAQTRLTIDTDAMKVDPKDQKPVDLKMKGVDQFDLYPGDADKGGKACFEAAVKACNDHNTKQYGVAAPKLGGPDEAIQMAYAEDANGRVEADKTQAEIGRAYIDKVLDMGYPAVIGASYADNSYNGDRMTDHFITIDKRGYDDQNRLYYEFKDPGAGGRVGRLYVDEDTGKLFKEGDRRGPYVQNADYEVTQVRTYKGI